MKMIRFTSRHEYGDIYINPKEVISLQQEWEEKVASHREYKTVSVRYLLFFTASVTILIKEASLYKEPVGTGIQLSNCYMQVKESASEVAEMLKNA